MYLVIYLFTCQGQVFNPYQIHYPLTLWRALLNDYEQRLLKVQMELTSHVIVSRWSLIH